MKLFFLFNLILEIYLLFAIFLVNIKRNKSKNKRKNDIIPVK